MKRIYLVRHGLSAGNLNKTHQNSETALTEKGREQAEFVGKRLKNLGIELVVSSSFSRARETAGIINQTLKQSIEFNDNLVEYRRPSIFHGKSYDESEAVKIRQEIEDRWHENWQHSDEETFIDFRSRVIKAIEGLLELDQQKILVVTHGLTIRMILAVMAFGPEVSAHEFRKLFHFFMTENTGITICEHHQYQDGRFQWKLITANDHEHLN